jgi:hypothetical protein
METVRSVTSQKTVLVTASVVGTSNLITINDKLENQKPIKEVLTAVTIGNTLFWIVTPCSLEDRHQYFGGTCGIRLQDRGPIDKGRTFLSTTLHGTTSMKTEIFEDQLGGPTFE